MADGWVSDWEKLFAKCAADADYRIRLASALADDDDTEVKALLDNIGAGGTGETARTARVSALKAARTPMAQVSTDFGETHPLGVAP